MKLESYTHGQSLIAHKKNVEMCWTGSSKQQKKTQKNQYQSILIQSVLNLLQNHWIGKYFEETPWGFSHGSFSTIIGVETHPKKTRGWGCFLRKIHPIVRGVDDDVWGTGTHDEQETPTCTSTIVSYGRVRGNPPKISHEPIQQNRHKNRVDHQEDNHKIRNHP